MRFSPAGTSESTAGSETKQPSAPKRRIRSVVYVAFLVLAAVLLFVANLLIWVNSSILDSKHFTARVSDVLAKPEVQKRLAEVLAKQAVDTGVIQEQVETRVPEQVSFLAPVVNSQLETLLTEAARRLLATDLAGGLERELTLRLHSQLMAILTDDDSALEVQGDALVLDLRELLNRLLERAGVHPPERLQQEERRLGTFVILDDTTGLREASWLLKNRHEIIFGLVSGSVVSFGLAITAAANKRNAIGATGYAVLSVGIVTLLVVVISNLVVAEMASERVFARELIKALEDNLRWQSVGLAIVGSCLVLASDTRTVRTLADLEGRLRKRYDDMDPTTRRFLLPAAAGGLVLLLLVTT